MAKNKTVAGTAQDPTVTFTPLEIAGRTYNLAYDFNAIAQAEETQNLNLLGCFLGGHLSATRLRAILYAGLLKAHPEITLQDAGKLISPKTVNLILEKISAAYDASMPEKKDQPEAEELAVAS